jgi:hypothetical protein
MYGPSAQICLTSRCLHCRPQTFLTHGCPHEIHSTGCLSLHYDSGNRAHEPNSFRLLAREGLDLISPRSVRFDDWLDIGITGAVRTVSARDGGVSVGIDDSAGSMQSFFAGRP